MTSKIALVLPSRLKKMGTVAENGNGCGNGCEEKIRYPALAITLLFLILFQQNLRPMTVRGKTKTYHLPIHKEIL